MSRHWLSILLLLFSMHAQGELLPFMPSPSELALLPDYCKARFTEQHSPEYQAWAQRVGPKFLSIHHYCAGLNYINRYQRLVNDEKRAYYLSRAVPEIDYVAQAMPAGFLLAGEIYLNRGIAYRLMRNDAAAARDFAKAIEHDPNQVRAYVYLSEFHARTGKKAQALELVSLALQRVPGNKALQRKYLELGGKEPFPVAPEGGTAMPQTEDAPPASTFGVEVAPIPSSDNADKLPQGVEDRSRDEEAKQPTIGAPGNPYCRFCP